jgi:hypothetical protein
MTMKYSGDFHVTYFSILIPRAEKATGSKEELCFHSLIQCPKDSIFHSGQEEALTSSSPRQFCLKTKNLSRNWEIYPMVKETFLPYLEHLHIPPAGV